MNLQGNEGFDSFDDTALHVAPAGVTWGAVTIDNPPVVFTVFDSTKSSTNAVGHTYNAPITLGGSVTQIQLSSGGVTCHRA